MSSNNNDGNEFTCLFDGQTIDGWCMAGPGKFVVVVSEKLLQSQGGMGLLWYTKRKYKDFVLKIDWKASHRNDNSGVFIRFSNPDNDPLVAVNTGYEIQIDDMAMPDGDPLHKTGAIYNFAAPLNLRSRRVGEWNTFEIEATGQNIALR
jgi:cytochrome c